MVANATLRYGFELDRAYFIDFAMQYQFYVPIATLPTLHPIIQYLLFFENKSMRMEIRMLYSLTHLALLLTEWTFCFAYRIYPVNPIGAVYCEGPLCRAGINKQVLMALISIPVILISAPFVTLMMRMHQMFVPLDSQWKLSFRTQMVLVVLLNLLLGANVVIFGLFGKDHDDSELLLQEPEMQWLLKRGGTIFMFGPPGDPQYFKWELRFLGLSILIISPFLIFFTADAMRNIATASTNLSSTTQVMARRMFHIFLFQCMGAVICYIVPLAAMLSLMIVDATGVPEGLFAGLRISLLIIFTLNGHQFVVFFVVKNPNYRKIVAEKFKQILRCKWSSMEVKQSTASPIGPKSFSISSRTDDARF